MPTPSYGPQVKRRTKRLLEALLNYANDELENCDHLKIRVNWQTEKQLVVRTKMRFLEELTALDPYGIKLTREQIKEAINRLKDFLEILEDNRPVTRGSEDWHFTLRFWYRRYDKQANLERFDMEWELRRSERSKQVLSNESPKTGANRIQTRVVPEPHPLPETVAEVRLLSNSKLVVIKLGDGSFEEGFPITLQIGEEGRSPSVEITVRLPAASEIPHCYSDWAVTYDYLGLSIRLEASATPVRHFSIKDKRESCYNAAQILRDHLNDWLDSESFRPIREKLLEQLVPSDEIRLIIQTDNIWLRRLPWHLWDFCDRYPKAEIALSPSSFEPPIPIPSFHSKVQILAILGNSSGIDIEADRLLLEQLPDAEVRFLVEPQRHELSEELWKEGWDILFFAGHSSSHSNGKTGRIYLNKTDSLTFEELKFAVRRAVERGLKIAIFNSCDGLGLARDLAELKIPQIVIMREPVPDCVSQEFLKYFLDAFSSGESFYLAVREARERLQGLEDRFPCATWLPIIFQNPAVVPPRWNELKGCINKNELDNKLDTIASLNEL
jgi:hypothetical protein